MKFIDLIRPIGDAFYKSLFICGVPFLIIGYVKTIRDAFKDDF